MTTVPSSWRKSTRSGQNSSCVEVGRFGTGAAVRDTKDHAAGYFTADREQWQAFVSAIKADRFA